MFREPKQPVLAAREGRESNARREDPSMSTFEIIVLVVIGVGFLGLIAYVADHARQWDDD